MVDLGVGRQIVEDGVLAGLEREFELVVGEGARRPWDIFLDLPEDPAHLSFLTAAVI